MLAQATSRQSHSMDSFTIADNWSNPKPVTSCARGTAHGYPTQCGPTSTWEQARTKRDNTKKDLRALFNNTKQRRERKLKLRLHAPTGNLTIKNTHEYKHLNPNADASVSQQPNCNVCGELSPFPAIWSS